MIRIQEQNTVERPQTFVNPPGLMMRLIKEVPRHILPYRFIRFVRELTRRVIPSLAMPTANEEKVHIRTDQELELRTRGLKEIRDILNTSGIPYYLSGGTLLGVIREGDFIKWDPDVDIDTNSEQIRPKQELLIAALKKAKFYIQYHNPSSTDFKITAIKHGTKYEITGYLKMGRMRYRRRCYYPDMLCQTESEITLRGEKYKTFSQPEKYLEWFYGDWKTPLRKTTDYFTTKSRTSPVALTLIEITSLYRHLMTYLNKFSNA